MELLIPVAVISGLGLVFGVCLAYASKKFEVKIDERVAQVREALPGANCGACGQTGCDGFAEGVVAGNCTINGCPVGGAQVAAKLSEIMGVEAGDMEAKTARVMCAGTDSKCGSKFAYSGVKSCTAAASLHGGPSACSYGCLGMGDCDNVCDFGAIVIENGIARIIESLCTSCGKCVTSCPKKIIKMVPKSSEHTVFCSSLDKGPVVRKNCSAGCIGCTKCTKVCPQNAITMKGALAVIDPELCNNCGECVKSCPTGSIVKYSCNYVSKAV